MPFMSRKRHKIKESEFHMTSAFIKSYKGEKTKYLDNSIEDGIVARMSSGVIKVGLVALVGTIIGVGVYGCKESKDYYNRGMARLEKGETDGAISDFTRAIKQNPRFGMAYYYRAMAYSHKQEYDQVIADYTRAIEIDPQRFAVACAERALIYYIKKEYDKAWEDVHNAESLGQEVRPEFLKALREASGRKR